jgi:hypothetical protein
LLGAFFPAPGPKPCPPAAGHDDRINGASFHSSFFPGNSKKILTAEHAEFAEKKIKTKINSQRARKACLYDLSF